MALTKAKTNMLAPKATEQEARDAVEGSWTDPAAVHAAFNQYGLGTSPQTNNVPNVSDIDDFDIDSGLLAVGIETVGTRPENGGNYAHLLVQRQATTGVSQIWINGNPTVGLLNVHFRVATGNTWSPWAEFYHSDNSVNPLDYGLRHFKVIDNNDAEHTDYLLSGFYASPNDPNSSLGEYPTFITVGSGLAGTALQISVEALYDRFFLRRTRNGTTQPSHEIYHDGNLNVDEFYGNATDDTIVEGVCSNTTNVVVLFPLSKYEIPSGVTMSGTFGVRKPNGTVLATGISSLAVSSQSSANYLRANIGSLSGLTAGEVVEIFTESASSKITVNY